MQTVVKLKERIRTARAPRFASRGAETPRWGVSRARLGESLRTHQKAHCNVLLQCAFWCDVIWVSESLQQPILCCIGVLPFCRVLISQPVYGGSHSTVDRGRRSICESRLFDCGIRHALQNLSNICIDADGLPLNFLRTNCLPLVDASVGGVRVLGCHLPEGVHDRGDSQRQIPERGFSRLHGYGENSHTAPRPGAIPRPRRISRHTSDSSSSVCRRAASEAAKKCGVHRKDTGR